MEHNILQNDEHFRVEVIDWHGVKAIRKSLQSTTNERRRLTFQNEIVGTAKFYEIAEAHQSWGLKVPSIFESGDSWMIREYLEGEPLCDETTTIEQAHQGLERLSTIVAQIDRIEPDEHAAGSFEDSAPYTNITKRFETWAKGPLESNVLIPAAFQAAKQLIDDFQPYLAPRYAHGDLSPLKHALIDGNGQISLFDFEHFSSQKPRYYDAAYCYSRLLTRVADRRVAASFLGSFLHSAMPVPHQDEQLLAIMTQRAIGMHFDALNDRPKGADYVKRAQEFLQLCLDRDVSKLCTVE
ncbi:MAG TPA: phosphotransferase [Candidatus Saccharimonadales bacterium]